MKSPETNSETEENKRCKQLCSEALTSKKCGICKMLGVSCCFNIPDYSDNITNIIDHMREAVKEPSPASGSGWTGWLMSLWSGWFFSNNSNCFANRGYGIINSVLFTMHHEVHFQRSAEIDQGRDS